MTNDWTKTPIPGETPIDPSDLKVKSIKTRAELNAAEAEEIRKTTRRYLAMKPSRRKAPFSFEWMLRLHEEMFGAVWNWGGQIRAVELNVGYPVASIAEGLGSLLDNLHGWTTLDMPFIEQAARLHHQAVRIHPFKNGNGRWSRMLANIRLRQHGQAIVAWPEDVIGTASTIRQEYLVAIQLADQGEFEPLIELHRKYQQNLD